MGEFGPKKKRGTVRGLQAEFDPMGDTVRAVELLLEGRKQEAARYFEAPGTQIVPLGLWGTERLMRPEMEKVMPTEVHARAGRAVDARELFERAGGKRPVVADVLGYLIADLLPPEYRGEYESAATAPAARSVASSFAA